MKNQIKLKVKNVIIKTGKYTLSILLPVLIVSGIAYAASNLTPIGTPSTANFFTLSDIYTKLTTNATTTAGSHFVSTTTSPAGTFRTLTEIYNAIPVALSLLASTTTVPVGLNVSTTTLTAIDSDLVAQNIATGTQIFGITGTLQGAPAPLTWQTPDPAISLCYSHGQYEIDSGNCSVGNGWIDSGGNTLGALEYCQYLNSNGTTLAITPQNIWHLPTITEYESITDFTRFNSATQITGFAEVSVYWSSTLIAEIPNSAWFWNTYYGYIDVAFRGNQSRVRCAR